ncbi:hypothetical protein PR002_g20296 [Phytophthora rubi]|uniref:Uncharacterized protein n=1 Tax=Phytophthora rubi TaxID=129364 RepID=A0A6A3JHR5_9STRA|nr:hypothetical protein PR002_g20296 [Phytophthora rubi]
MRGLGLCVLHVDAVQFQQVNRFSQCVEELIRRIHLVVDVPNVGDDALQSVIVLFRHLLFQSVDHSLHEVVQPDTTYWCRYVPADVRERRQAHMRLNGELISRRIDQEEARQRTGQLNTTLRGKIRPKTTKIACS